MSIKKFGIYLAYPPTVDLRYEGLGRLLAAFLKGAAERGDTHFTIACPSWSKKSLQQLFLSEGVPEAHFDLVYPSGYNSLLKLYELYAYIEKKFFKREKTSSRFKEKLKQFLNGWSFIETFWLQKLVSSRNFLLFILYLIPGSFFLVIKVFFASISFVTLRVQRLIKKVKGQERKIKEFIKTRPFLVSFFRLFAHFQFRIPSLKNYKMVYNLLQLMEKKETELILDRINKMKDITAWYSPTAFWPEFNQIPGPKLICVPDMVLKEFPIGFSMTGGYRVFEAFKKAELAICGGQQFVTYSQCIKENVLIKSYKVSSENIHVIPHAANTLDEVLAASKVDEHQLLASAIKKATNKTYLSNFETAGLKFMFYASQFRSSKNVLTLLRAYHYLLRERYITHKLLLTGKPAASPEVDAFVKDNYLTKEVLFVPGLNLQELAACYKLATIVVNPSLSEGGCPFTFTEALSVNTPVIMADISVTTEVITDKSLQKMMLFDPYNWKNLAEKLEWALTHRTELLIAQQPVYELLKQRTWRDVVTDHINVLHHISGSAPMHGSQSMQSELELEPC